MSVWKKIVLVVMGLALTAALLPWVLVWLGNLQYPDNPARARVFWSIAKYVSLYDRDTVLFNIGNAHLLDGRQDDANVSYESADRIASKELKCPIHYNWAKSLESQGDAAAEAKRNAEARAKYSEALGVVSLNACMNSGEHGEKFTALYEVLLKKLAEAKSEDSSQSGEEEQQDGDPSDDGSDSDSDRAEEIIRDNDSEARQKQIYHNRARTDDRDNGDDGGTSEPDYGEFTW